MRTRTNALARRLTTLLIGSLLSLSSCRGTGSGDQPAPHGPAPNSAASPLELPAGTYALDPPHTFVYFAAQHKVVGMVRGRFDKMSGVLTVAKDPGACSVDVSIETSSVSTQNSIRDEDLRGADFFDAAKFSTMQYRGRGIRKSGSGWMVDGSLTIRGVTKLVPLSFELNGVAPPQPGKPNRVGFHGRAAVKRADFGMVRDLLDEIPKGAVGPDVWIEIDAEALASEPSKL